MSEIGTVILAYFLWPDHLKADVAVMINEDFLVKK